MCGQADMLEVGGALTKKDNVYKARGCEQEVPSHSNIKCGGVKRTQVGWAWSEPPLMKDFVVTEDRDL